MPFNYQNRNLTWQLRTIFGNIYMNRNKTNATLIKVERNYSLT